MSVASPVAPGARSVGPRAARRPLSGRAGAESRGQPDRDGEHGSRSETGQDEARRSPRAARMSLGLDPRAQAGRRVDVLHGASRECEGPLLLGEPRRELRRRSDSRLERRTLLRR